MGPSSNFLYNNSEEGSISEIYLMRFIYILKNSAIRLNDKNEIIFFFAYSSVDNPEVFLD